jgi:hypothetical protein
MIGPVDQVRLCTRGRDLESTSLELAVPTGSASSIGSLMKQRGRTAAGNGPPRQGSVSKGSAYIERRAGSLTWGILASRNPSSSSSSLSGQRTSKGRSRPGKKQHSTAQKAVVCSLKRFSSPSKAQRQASKPRRRHRLCDMHAGFGGSAVSHRVVMSTVEDGDSDVACGLLQTRTGLWSCPARHEQAGHSP